MRRAETLKQIMKSNLHSSPLQVKQVERKRSGNSSSSATNQTNEDHCDTNKGQHISQAEATDSSPVSQKDNPEKPDEESFTKTSKTSDHVRGIGNEALESLRKFVKYFTSIEADFSYN